MVLRTTALVLAIPALAGCGGAKAQYRTVDTPVAEAIQFGAPKNTRYLASAEAERGFVRIIVREVSDCDRLKVKIVRRVTEVVQGDDVKHRSDPQNVQVVEGVEGAQECQQRFARQVRIALRIGDQTHRLGFPNQYGEVAVDLMERLGQDLYEKALPAEAIVMVEEREAGTVSLAGARAHQERVNQLIDELRALLATKQSEQSSLQIARAYEIYEQLIELAPLDARLRGLETRLLELVFDRHDFEVSESFERNVQILNKAKNVLASGAAVGVPIYARDAVLAGTLVGPALGWASVVGAMSLARYPSLCAGHGTHFEWSHLDAGAFPAATHVAMSYLRFAHGDGYAGVLGRLCRRFR